MGINILLAILLPWAMGVLIMLKIWGIRKWQDFLIIIGVGYFLGFALLTRVYFYLSYDATFVMFGVSVLMALGVIINANLPVNKIKLNSAIEINKVRFGLMLLFFAWVLLRLTIIYDELILQPVIAWDAWSEHLTKGKLWHGYLSGNPLLNKLSIQDIHVDSFHPFSSNFASIITLWMSLAIGKWDESYIMLPWFISIFSTLLVMMGFINYKSSNIEGSVFLILFILLSPMLNVHLALPGYLDIWVASIVSILVGFLYLISINKNYKKNCVNIIVVLLMVLPIIKYKAGVVWSINIALVCLYSLLSKRFVSIFALVFFIICFYVYLNEICFSLDEPGTIKVGYCDNKVYMLTYAFSLIYDSKGLFLLCKYLFFSSAWNIFWFLAMIAIIHRGNDGSFNLVRSVILIGITEILFFSLTNNSVPELTDISKSTSLQRGFMHIYIAVSFIVACKISIMCKGASVRVD